MANNSLGIPLGYYCRRCGNTEPLQLEVLDYYYRLIFSRSKNGQRYLKIKVCLTCECKDKSMCIERIAIYEHEEQQSAAASR